MRNILSIIFCGFCLMGYVRASHQAPPYFNIYWYDKPISNATASTSGGPSCFISLPFQSKPNANEAGKVASVAQQFRKNANPKKMGPYRKDCFSLHAIYKNGKPSRHPTPAGENDVSIPTVIRKNMAASIGTFPHRAIWFSSII